MISFYFSQIIFQYFSQFSSQIGNTHFKFWYTFHYFFTFIIISHFITYSWVYSDQSITESLPFSGSISSYGGGGFYVDFKLKKTETIDIIKELKDNLWVTRGTRAIFLDFSVYNANVNIFGICKLLFEFPTIGGVIPKAYIQSIRLIRLHDTYDYFILSCEILFYCFVVFYVLEVIRELIYFGLRYFTQFWSYMDLIIIMVSRHLRYISYL